MFRQPTERLDASLQTAYAASASLPPPPCRLLMSMSCWKGRWLTLPCYMVGNLLVSQPAPQASAANVPSVDVHCSTSRQLLQAS